MPAALFTPTQRMILTLLAGGKPRSFQDLVRCLPRATGMGALKYHVFKIRKVLRTEGDTIVSARIPGSRGPGGYVLKGRAAFWLDLDYSRRLCAAAPCLRCGGPSTRFVRVLSSVTHPHLRYVSHNARVFCDRCFPGPTGRPV